MIEVQIGRTDDDPRKINKTFTADQTVNCYMKEPYSVLSPTFILDYKETYLTCNYCYANGRYYFIDSFSGDPGGKMEINCREDVLKTYATQIVKEKAVVERTSDWEQKNLYLSDPEVKPYQYTRTWTRLFPSFISPNYSNFYLITIG